MPRPLTPRQIDGLKLLVDKPDSLMLSEFSQASIRVLLRERLIEATPVAENPDGRIRFRITDKGRQVHEAIHH